MKIVVFEAGDRERDGFALLSENHEVVFRQAPLTAENAALDRDADAVSVFVYSRIDPAVLDAMPGLRLITTRSTGYDHIDTETCARRDIAVCNVPNYGANTVAEHVFALLLGLSRHLVEASARARDGRFSPEGLTGFDLAGRTLGIIGAGSIGRHVARIGLGFDMRVLAYDPKPDIAFAPGGNFAYVGFDALVVQADVISLHVPATPETHHLLSRAVFARMKDGVVIINTARGTLIETPALVSGLLSGKVAGAGLDVLPDEPLIREEAELVASAFAKHHDLADLVADHVLLRLPNVIVTPHSAYLTREALARIVTATAGNIEAFSAGTPRNLVTLSPAPA